MDKRQSDLPRSVLEPTDAQTAMLLEELARLQASRQAQQEQRLGPIQRRIVLVADRIIFVLSKHWLVLFNLMAFLYIGLPVLAPVLMHAGLELPARAIYAVYKPLCNQLPQRSWFLFGPQAAYSLDELTAWGLVNSPFGPETRAFVGTPSLGYKMALCQRCTAIYGTIFIAGVLFTLVRRRLRPLSWWGYLLVGILPMGLDGGYQLLSYLLPLLWPGSPLLPHETTPLMRTITGTLFGLATVWLAYPYVQETMDEFYETLHRRFGWE
ncbi:MAG TPA: DUF2085 domain-containing protein [Anaerolineae bacterium]|nr:DUF2085 domain-containing protein [Anaerolineae bacterium]